MSERDILDKSKQDFDDIIRRIGTDEGVGIDTQLTHAYIIAYLQEISRRLDKLENALKNKHIL